MFPLAGTTATRIENAFRALADRYISCDECKGCLKARLKSLILEWSELKVGHSCVAFMNFIDRVNVANYLVDARNALPQPSNAFPSVNTSKMLFTVLSYERLLCRFCCLRFYMYFEGPSYSEQY